MGSTSQVPVMNLYILLACILTGGDIVRGQDCCPKLVVSDMPGLDDTYTLSERRNEKPEDVCNDGCIYTRENAPDDEYCFKSEETNGQAECQDDPADLQTQKSEAEADVRNLEDDVARLEAEEQEANELNDKLDQADAKVEELTSESTTPSGRVRRQDPTPTPPETCDEIADLIDQLADSSKTIAQRLSLVEQILATKVTRCKSKDKLTKTKIKIKTVKTETGIKIKIIKKEKDKKTKEIEKLKIVIKIIEEQIGGNTGITEKPPTPTGEVEVPMNSTGETPVSMEPGEGGEKPVSMEPGEEAVSMNPGGVTLDPTGQAPVEMGTGKPTGQQPVEMGGFTGEPTGQQAVEINSTGKPTGQQAVEINPTGQQAVEINPTGQQAVEISQTGQQAVEVEMSTAAP